MTMIKNDFGPRFRQEQREREEFLRNTRESNRTITVTQQIENAIADADGNIRDALNDVLASRDAAVALFRAENAKTLALIVVLEEIRAILWPDAIDTRETRAIEKIVCDALRVAGGAATTIEEATG